MPSFFSQAAPDRHYLPRSARMNLSFPVEFRSDEVTAIGSCQNISESGLMVRFRKPPELWTNGDLWCDTGTMILELRVRIVRAHDRDIGLVFKFRNELEREAVRSVVAFAALHTGLAGGRPLF